MQAEGGTFDNITLTCNKCKQRLDPTVMSLAHRCPAELEERARPPRPPRETNRYA